MKTFTLLLFVVLNYYSVAQTVVFSNNDLKIVLSTTYIYDTILVTKVEVTNLSNSNIYLPKEGYTAPNFFPSNKTILDFTNSKLGKGNPHYYSSNVQLDLIKPKDTLTFTDKSTSKCTSCNTADFIYEYIVTSKTLKNKMLTGNKYLSLIEKINLTFNICVHP